MGPQRTQCDGVSKVRIKAGDMDYRALHGFKSHPSRASGFSNDRALTHHSTSMRAQFEMSDVRH